MATPAPRPRRRRSILFAPGSRPERFVKAVASGADAVCLDLEDGVAPDAKEAARAAVAAWLAARGEPREGAPEILVRVNDPSTELGRADLAALAAVRLPDGVMVPKVDGPEVLAVVLGALGREPGKGGAAGEAGAGRGGAADADPDPAVGAGLDPAAGAGPDLAAGAGSGKAGPDPAADAGPALFPLIETAKGLHRVEELAAAPLPIAALVFGGMDMAAELGARFAWEPLLYARSRVVHAAALGGVGAVDVPWADLQDTAGLEEEARRGAALGFTGKLAIHPAQVPWIHRGIEPDAEERARAERVIRAALRSRDGVQVVDGRMVDKPIVDAAKRVLARAGVDWTSLA